MTSKAAAFGAYLAALWAAHDLADHVVQTDAQAAGKGNASGWAGPMAGHVGGYTAVQVLALVALRPLGLRLGWRRLALGVAWSAGTHAFLDRRWPVRAALDATGSRGFARPQVLVEVRGETAPSALAGRQPSLDAMGTGPLPLHGPYLADQAGHHVALAVMAWFLARGHR